MKEITAIIAAYDQLDFTKTQAALATVVRVAGSSYRREGARMLITSDGQWTGGISGGCLEGDALRKAQQAIFQQKPRVVTYDTTQDDPFQIGVGLGCRGIIDVLIEPIDAEDWVNPIELLKVVAKQEGNAALAVVTASQSEDLPVGTRFLKSEGLNLTSGLPPGECWNMLEECATRALGETENNHSEVRLSDGNFVKIFTEFIQPPIHLVAFGSNYDVLPLLEIGKTLGWKLSVAGDLKKFSKSVFELAGVVTSDTDWQSVLQPDERTAAVLMAHDYKADFANLIKLLPTRVSYIGMLGPKKRQERILEDLEKEGIHLTAKDEARIHGPAGLDIGATTPEGIAMSIAAEIQACFGGRRGGFLRERDAPIYDPKPEDAYAK